MGQSEPINVDKLIEIQKLFEDELNVTIESFDMDLIDSGILDSLMLVDLIMLLDAKYGVVVDIAELEFDHFRSVQNVCKYVEQNAAA